MIGYQPFGVGHITDPPRERTPMAFVTLRILHGTDRGRIFDNLPTPVTIGREEGNSIQLHDERISRYHLKLQEDNDKIVLTDLESTNGTKVNGEDIQVRILRDGDMISVGRSLLLVGRDRGRGRGAFAALARWSAAAAIPVEPRTIGRTFRVARLRASHLARGHRRGRDASGK